MKSARSNPAAPIATAASSGANEHVVSHFHLDRLDHKQIFVGRCDSLGLVAFDERIQAVAVRIAELHQ